MSRRTKLDAEDRLALAGVLAEADIRVDDVLTVGDTGTLGDPVTVIEEHPVDGRHARSERSRQAMVDALLDLLREGTVRPSSAQIAERAGVTQRTLFNQFGDMDSLVTAAAGRQVHRFMELQPHAGAGPLDERVARYCVDLERLLEETMHLRWAVISNPATQPTGDRVVRGVLRVTRRRLAEAFAPELESLDDDARDEVLDVLELEADPVVWRLRRLQQELTPTEARALVQRTMLAVLRDACARSDPGVRAAPAGALLTDRSVSTS